MELTTPDVTEKPPYHQLLPSCLYAVKWSSRPPSLPSGRFKSSSSSSSLTCSAQDWIPNRHDYVNATWARCNFVNDGDDHDDDDDIHVDANNFRNSSSQFHQPPPCLTAAAEGIYVFNVASSLLLFLYALVLFGFWSGIERWLFPFDEETRGAADGPFERLIGNICRKCRKLRDFLKRGGTEVWPYLGCH